MYVLALCILDAVGLKIGEEQKKGYLCLKITCGGIERKLDMKASASALKPKWNTDFFQPLTDGQRENGELGICITDEEYQVEIDSLTIHLSNINKLRTAEYKMKNGGTLRMHEMIENVSAVETRMRSVLPEGCGDIKAVLEKHNYNENDAAAELLAGTIESRSVKLPESAKCIEEGMEDVESIQQATGTRDINANFQGTFLSFIVVVEPPQPIPIKIKRKALLIGINYLRTASLKLDGCINDVKTVQKIITKLYGFPDTPQTLTVMTDDSMDKRYHPTRNNILAAIDWLVYNNDAGSRLFFFYAGHGTQSPDATGREEDDQNEVLVPQDYDPDKPCTAKNLIIDDELQQRLVAPLKAGVRLTAITDCCHSGTILDLPYTWDVKKMQWNLEKKPTFFPSDVIHFSGCKDREMSGDASPFAAKPGGCMTTAFAAAIAEDPYHQCYDGLLNRVHRKMGLQANFQKPQLSASQPFRNNRTFGLTDILSDICSCGAPSQKTDGKTSDSTIRESGVREMS